MGSEVVKVTLKTDARGMLGRRCPSSDCAQYFKLKPGTGLSTSKCHCPYCGASGDAQSFSTKDQIEYAKTVAAKQVVEPLLRKFGQNLNRISNQTRGGLIELKFSMRSAQFRVHHYREADVETDVTCDHCGLEFAVYGVFAMCPDCSRLNAFAVFAKSMEVCRTRLALLELDETKDDPELERSILRDALTSSIGAFDALGKRLREAAPDVFPAKPKNLFQNFDALDSALLASGQGVAARLGCQDQASRMRLLFQVRHIIEHNMAVADDDFVRIMPAFGHLRGKIYPLTRGEVEELLVLLADLTETLRQDLEPPTAEMPA
jgi:hypothetical protein